MNANRFRRLAAASLLATSAGFAGFAIGCDDGPAEEAGEAIDDAADDAIDDAADEVDDAIDNP